jgi:hypothetical protein
LDLVIHHSAVPECGHFALLAPGLRQAKLKLDEVLAAAGQPVSTICFPEAGIVTVSDVMNDGSRVGIGHFGFDGFAGWPALLGCDRSPHEARVTADGGTGFYIVPSELLSACRASETLRDLLLRFVQAFQVQLGAPSSPTSCNRWRPGSAAGR